MARPICFPLCLRIEYGVFEDATEWIFYISRFPLICNFPSWESTHYAIFPYVEISINFGALDSLSFLCVCVESEAVYYDLQIMTAPSIATPKKTRPENLPLLRRKRAQTGETILTLIALMQVTSTMRPSRGVTSICRIYRIVATAIRWGDLSYFVAIYLILRCLHRTRKRISRVRFPCA